MFKSIKGNPRTVVIQKYSRKKNWVDLGTYLDAEGITLVKANNLLRFVYDNIAECVSPSTLQETKIRIIVRGKKSKRELLVLSNDNNEFFELLNGYINNPRVVIVVDGKRMYSDSENPHFKSLTEFMEWTWEHNGISKATLRTPCVGDGNLQTYDITFVDGEKHTCSLLYT